MVLKKGMFLVFRNRTEKILSASNDKINGIIKTDKNEYSVDFIMRWLEFGFITIIKEQEIY